MSNWLRVKEGRQCLVNNYGSGGGNIVLFLSHPDAEVG